MPDRRVGSTLIGLAIAAVLIVAAANPVRADTIVTFPVESGTILTFTVLSGPLSVTAPASTALGAAAPAASITAVLGTVTVTDARAVLAPTWAAAVSATDFTTGGATAAETIANADVNYWSGPAVVTSGAATTFVPGQPTSADQVPLSTSPTAFSLTAGIGANDASWNPTLVVLVPASALAGVYIGTITHSVA